MEKLDKLSHDRQGDMALVMVSLFVRYSDIDLEALQSWYDEAEQVLDKVTVIGQALKQQHEQPN